MRIAPSGRSLGNGDLDGVGRLLLGDSRQKDEPADHDDEDDDEH